MQKHNRRLALLLAAVMLTSILPVNALAVETPADDPAVSIEEPADTITSPTPAESGTEEDGTDGTLEGGEEAEQPEQGDSETSATNGEGIVTCWLSDGEPQSLVPDADGNYTVDLGRDPFFPYEAAVETEDGEVYDICFADEGDSVRAGGSIFTAACTGTPQKIGLWVNGTYFPACPEAVSTYSMQPLEEKWFTVNLRHLLGSELSEVRLDTVLTDPNNPDESTYGKDTKVVWGLRNSSDRFTIADKDTIDLSTYMERGGDLYLELIVGTADQLDPDNTRYLVSLELTDPRDLLAMTASAGDQTQTIRLANRSANTIYMPDESWESYYTFSRNVSFWDKDDIKLTMNFDQTQAENKDALSGLSVEVYAGLFDSAEDAAGSTPVTSQIWGAQADGYLADYCSLNKYGYNRPDAETMPFFTAVFQRNGKAVYTTRFGIFVNSTNPYDILDFDVYHEGTEIVTSEFNPNYHTTGETVQQLYEAGVAKEDMEKVKNADVSVKFREYSNDDTNGVTVKIFDGEYDITEKVWNVTAPDYKYDFQSNTADVKLLRAELTKGEKKETLEFALFIYRAGISVSLNNYIYKQDSDGSRISVSSGSNCNWNDDPYGPVYTFTLYTGYSATDAYYLNLHLYNSNPNVTNDSSDNGLAYVSRAVAGKYTTEAEVKGQPDIKDKLFESVESYIQDSGYLADFSPDGSLAFTVLDTEGDIHHVTVNLKERSYTPSSSHYLNVYDLKEYSSYQMKSSDDSYYERGYQTLLVLDHDGQSVQTDQITPLFSKSDKTNIYIGLDQSSGIRQESGESAIPFESGKTQHYSAAAENGVHLSNYYVTFITAQDDAKLFVNAVSNSEHKNSEGTAEREATLPNANSYHDVFIANIGREELTGLSVSLDENPLVKLDDYWTIQSDSVKKLAGFTRTSSSYMDEDGNWHYASYGELPNTAKIRLLPKLDSDGKVQAGIVDANLTVSSENGGSETVHLTGLSGKLSIVTDSVVPGVKYVPYSSVIQTNALRGAGLVKFEIVEGNTPLGVELRPNGELYGVPKAAGTFTFTVKASFDGYDDTAVEQEYVLEILENTDENVWQATDTNYNLIRPVGTSVGNSEVTYEVQVSGDQLFWSNGEYSYFIDFYLDGEPQIEGQDYISASGSTKITVLSQTIKKVNDGKTHTIAAEFREGDRDNGRLQRAAQNFSVNIKQSSGGGNNSNKKPSSSSKPTASTPSTPPTPPAGNTTPQQPQLPTPFQDVPAGSWFVDDVKWIRDAGLMNGESDTRFSPNEPISQATIVVVLARLAKADLSRYTNETEETIPADHWYTTAAIWAKRSGLLPDRTTFTGTAPISRDQMAIMLVKYMGSTGLDTSVPEQRVAFADAGLMSQDGNDAFQVLYKHGIFKGVGGLNMDPAGLTTRAQFSALIHRMSDFTEAQKD